MKFLICLFMMIESLKFLIKRKGIDMDPSQNMWLVAMAIRLFRLGLEIFKLFRDLWDTITEKRYSEIQRKAKRKIFALLHSSQRHLVFRKEKIYQNVGCISEVIDDALYELYSQGLIHQLHGGWIYGAEPNWH